MRDYYEKLAASGKLASKLYWHIAKIDVAESTKRMAGLDNNVALDAIVTKAETILNELDTQEAIALFVQQDASLSRYFGDQDGEEIIESLLEDAQARSQFLLALDRNFPKSPSFNADYYKRRVIAERDLEVLPQKIEQKRRECSLLSKDDPDEKQIAKLSKEIDNLTSTLDKVDQEYKKLTSAPYVELSNRYAQFADDLTGSMQKQNSPFAEYKDKKNAEGSPYQMDIEDLDEAIQDRDFDQSLIEDINHVALYLKSLQAEYSPLEEDDIERRDEIHKFHKVLNALQDRKNKIIETQYNRLAQGVHYHANLDPEVIRALRAEVVGCQRLNKIITRHEAVAKRLKLVEKEERALHRNGQTRLANRKAKVINGLKEELARGDKALSVVDKYGVMADMLDGMAGPSVFESFADDIEAEGSPYEMTSAEQKKSIGEGAFDGSLNSEIAYIEERIDNLQSDYLGTDKNAKEKRREIKGDIKSWEKVLDQMENRKYKRLSNFVRGTEKEMQQRIDDRIKLTKPSRPVMAVDPASASASASVSSRSSSPSLSSSSDNSLEGSPGLQYIARSPDSSLGGGSDDNEEMDELEQSVGPSPRAKVNAAAGSPIAGNNDSIVLGNFAGVEATPELLIEQKVKTEAFYTPIDRQTAFALLREGEAIGYDNKKKYIIHDNAEPSKFEISYLRDDGQIYHLPVTGEYLSDKSLPDLLQYIFHHECVDDVFAVDTKGEPEHIAEVQAQLAGVPPANVVAGLRQPQPNPQSSQAALPSMNDPVALSAKASLHPSAGLNNGRAGRRKMQNANSSVSSPQPQAGGQPRLPTASLVSPSRSLQSAAAAAANTMKQSEGLGLADPRTKQRLGKNE